jgi:hypothetical protein
MRDKIRISRRAVLRSAAVVAGGAIVGPARRTARADETGSAGPALVAITLDLEMARNFPRWEMTHWDYEKGNLDQAAKDYTLRACRRVKERGGVVHTFVVGQVFEQADVGWLKEIAEAGHRIGNHTYDHVYLLADKLEDLQFRFQRAPWLVRGRTPAEVIRENILLTNLALETRIGVTACGFRTPGGFHDGLIGREDLQKMLQELGFHWVSSRYPSHAGIRDLHGSGQRPSQEAYDNIVAAQDRAQPFVYPTGLIEVPMSPISDIGAFRNGRWRLDDFLVAVQLGVEWAIEQGGVYDLLAHPSCLGVVDPELRTIDLVCDLVERSAGRARLVDLETIAAQFSGA